MKVAGASAYLTKEASPEDFYQAIHSVLFRQTRLQSIRYGGFRGH